MSAAEHNSIASEFDVIVDEVKKFWPSVNVIAIVQVKTKSQAVKHAARFNLH